MLLHPAYRILAAAVPLVVACSAASSDTSSNDASIHLWSRVPKCAQKCVVNFVRTEYTAEECTTPSNIECLCKTRTPSGLTLGEGALSCVYALCPQNIVKSSNVYRICDSVSGALLETHPTLTATAFPGALTTISTTTRTMDTASSERTLETASTIPTSAISMTPTKSSLSPDITTYNPAVTHLPSLPPNVGTEPAITSASNSPTGEGSKHVSAGTVIGASVASGVAGSFIIVVAVFFCCKRWRQNNRIDDTSSSEFEIGGTMTEPFGWSESPSNRSTPGPGPGPSSSGARTDQEMSQSIRNSGSESQPSPRFYATTTSNGRRSSQASERVGFAISTDTELDTSPRTLSSQNTLAELLPNQNAALYPKPLKWNHRPVSRDTVFEEDELQQGTTAKQPNLTSRSGSPNIITGLPANPRALKEGFPAQRFLRAGSPQSQSQVPPSAARSSTTTHRGYPVSNIRGAPTDISGSSQHPLSSTHLTVPFSIAQGRIPSGTSRGYSDQANPTPAPAPAPASASASASAAGRLAPSAEIISRPRIVKADDIKRVEIRSSPRPRSSSEVGTAYCPEDFWLQRGRSLAPHPASSELPYPSETYPGAVLYPSSPKKRPEDRSKRVSPTSRNLTPSRRGDDLILRVE